MELMTPPSALASASKSDFFKKTTAALKMVRHEDKLLKASAAGCFPIYKFVFLSSLCLFLQVAGLCVLLF